MIFERIWYCINPFLIITAVVVVQFLFTQDTETVYVQTEIEKIEYRSVSLEDIDVKIFNAENTVSAVLDFSFSDYHQPKEMQISVRSEGGNLIISNRDNQERIFQVSKTNNLNIFNSTLYHQPGNDRLVIEMLLE